MKHEKDSENMSPDDKMVVFKLYDMKYPIAGRLRQFVDKGRFTDSDYVYIHRGDGTILHKYSYGYEILTEIVLPKNNLDSLLNIKELECWLDTDIAMFLIGQKLALIDNKLSFIEGKGIVLTNNETSNKISALIKIATTEGLLICNSNNEVKFK